MNNQTLILIGVGLFVGLVVTIAAVEHYLLSEHDPLEPSGLIWRVETAFSRIKDLEAAVQYVKIDKALEGFEKKLAKGTGAKEAKKPGFPFDPLGAPK
jgi:hypothetical protein